MASWTAKGMMNSSSDIDKIKDSGSPDESRATIWVESCRSAEPSVMHRAQE
jgi:hypothetical protein